MLTEWRGEAMIIDKIWGTVSYVGAVYLAAFLVASGMSKRRCFVSLAILLGVVAAAISFGYEELIRYLNLDRLVTLALRTSNCFLIFIMVLVSVRICFICHRWEALFCATAGYCMEHISQRLVAIINLLSDGLDKYVEGTLLIVVTSVFYIVMYIFVIRKTSPAQRIADGKVQIIVSIVTLMVAIFVNSFASVLISSAGEEKLSVFVHIFSMLSCMLILFVEFYQIKYRGAVMEQNILEQIIHQERESYERERSAVDVINIKCHDLKHQLSALKGKIDGNEYKELKDAVYAYDSVFKTGNEALDTVLYMKGMDCEANNISLTCLADGKLLKFMADSDVYSLFGNILDNAIEACRQIADIGKRIILFNIYKTGNIANIDIINYFGGGVDSISLKDGLPQTTKADKNYHGFGMSSIKRIVDKYEGSLCVKVNRDEFTLGISFFV